MGTMRTIVAAVGLMLASALAAQDSDASRIFINVIQPDRAEIPAEAGKQLETKLVQLISNNGMADTDPANRFVLTAKAMVQTKDIVPGPPQRVSMNIDFVFIVGDAVENKVFETATVSAIGVGQNENKAFIAAIKNIKPKSPELVEFLGKAKQKMLDYYEMRCGQIQTDARQAAAAGRYDEAIYMLMQVPEVCACGDECQELMIEYSHEQLNATAARLLNEAKAVWASSPNAEGAEKAADVIAQIPAGSASQKGVEALTKEINAKLRSDEARAWQFKMKQYNDRIEREKRQDAMRAEQQRADNEHRRVQQAADNEYRERQQAANNEYRRVQQAANNAARRQYIEAARQVGIAYAKNQPKTINYTKNVILW